jgi:hypothetical protein
MELSGLVTNTMGQFWDVDSRSAGKQITRTLWNLKVYCPFQHNPSTESVFTEYAQVCVLREIFLPTRICREDLT